MAKKLESKVFNVSVVGLSGTEGNKGVQGVGKSCLCNRFMSPHADSYYTDHISVLSQTDFGGRIVNNDHFLYWGSVTKTSDDALDYTFHIIEQTEFVDDSSFQTFKSGKPDPYIKRCMATKVQSAEKLMYICKNQLGLEHDYNQVLMPDGKLSIDGFICVFDISQVHQRRLEHQVEFFTLILNNLVKTKKPIVVVTTKHDEANDQYIREVERIVARKEYRSNIPIVETSAHENINVELAYMTLAHLIDKSLKGQKTKIVPYQEAAKARKEVLDVARDAYQHHLRSLATDYNVTWSSVHKLFLQNPDYNHYVDLCGTDSAKKLFRRHVRQLREDHISMKERRYLEGLKTVLEDMLPDLAAIADRSWPTTQAYLKRHEYFDTYFIEMPPDVMSWKDGDHIESNDPRIPFDLLDSNEAENIFRNHINALHAVQKRTEMKRQFKEMLDNNLQVTPGKPLSEVVIFFLGRECWSFLSDQEKHLIYDQHQAEIREDAKIDFQELLLEHAELFAKLDPHGDISAEDLKRINFELKDEQRYKILCRLENERKVMLLNHLGFVQYPFRDKCPFREYCMEQMVERLLLNKAHRPQSWIRASQWLLDSHDNQLNLNILGCDGLADELTNEIRSHCIDDEYSLGGAIYSLDYRPIDGDVNLPHNAFRSEGFLPHGCFCVFSNEETLSYVQESLEKTLLSDLEREDRLPFQGLPIVIILAFDSSLSDKELAVLREEGGNLADRLQCPFIDIPSHLMLEESQKFDATQIDHALRDLIECIKYRAEFINPLQLQEAIEPDIRIVMCCMCGDNYNLETPLGPLLNHQCCYIIGERTLILETYLDDSKRRVEVIVTSYHHGATIVQDSLVHGYILVYSSKRKASLAAVKALITTTPTIPIQLLAVTESGGANAFFSSDYTQALITEGNALADKLHARFMTTSASFKQQTAAYTPFFKEVWDNKTDTEETLGYGYSDDEPDPSDMYELGMRPPPALPKLPKRIDSYGVNTRGSASNSQSTEDSEPVYDQLQRYAQSDSDHEHDRASSTSPTFYDNTSPYGTVNHANDAYSDVSTSRNCDQPLRPSQVKNRRNIYAGWNENQYDIIPSEQTDWTDKDPLVSSSPQGSLNRRNNQQVKSKPAVKPKPLNMHRFSDVTNVIRRNLGYSKQQHPQQQQQQQQQQGFNYMPIQHVQAPLATPEHVEIGDYAQVRDAVQPQENDYALVQDALPAGKLHRIKSTFRKQQDVNKGGTDSDSEFSSLERKPSGDLYNRVHRKPTPHKKKHKQRSYDSGISSTISGTYGEPPMLPPYTIERHLSPHNQTTRSKFCSNSPSEGSEGTGDELATGTKPQKKRRSLKMKKKKSLENEGSLTVSMSDSDYLISPMSKSFQGSIEDDPYEPVMTGAPGAPARYPFSDEEVCDLGEGDPGYWKRKWKLRSDKDPDKLRRKEEKRIKKVEERRQKEEERKLKEQQKTEKRKMKKKDSKSGAPQSGRMLEDYIQSEENLIPLFLEKCIYYIETEGITMEGLYRVPGNRAQVELLFDKFKEDPNVDFASLDIPVNAFATALKTFFSDLHEPLVPSAFYDELIEAAGIPDKSGRLLALRGVLKKLPDVNREVLRYVITHIHKVTEFSDQNNMDIKNLAICFWPTLLRPEIPSFEKMALISKHLEDIVVTLIEQHGFFFYNDVEV